MEVGQIIALLSGAGIGTILSAILVFLNNSKRNQIDYITKERAEWRRQLKTILEDLKDNQKKDSAPRRAKMCLSHVMFLVKVCNKPSSRFCTYTVKKSD